MSIIDLMHDPNLVCDYLTIVIEHTQSTCTINNKLSDSEWLNQHLALNCISKVEIEYLVAECLENYYSDSLMCLLLYKGPIKLELKLMPDIYDINPDLYSICQAYDAQDTYYDAITQGDIIHYAHPTVLDMQISQIPITYRDVYHCLLYGESHHLKALILRWNTLGNDYTANIARDFFKLEPESDISIVISYINEYLNFDDESKMINHNTLNDESLL